MMKPKRPGPKRMPRLYTYNSCGQEMFSFIEEFETAKSAWEVLEQECKVVQAYDVNNDDHSKRYISFIEFVSSGDWDKAKECLGEVDVRSVARAIDLTNGFGDTALHVAARRGHVDIVKELVVLMIQEDLETKNADGYTALHTATIYGQVKIVKELGPWMRDVKDDFGRTALHIAVNEEQLDIVKELVLLMNQEDLAIKNYEGYTALHLAVYKGNVPIVKQLMTKEGEYDFNPYVPFTTCVNEGDWDKANECLRQLDNPYDAITRVDPRDGYGNTALHVAAIKGFAQIVKELVSLLKVRQEEDLELKTAQDFTTFGSGISLGVSEVLLMEGAKYMIGQYDKMLTNILEIQNAKGYTALHIAVTEGNVDIVKELVPLMRRESSEIKDVGGYTALHKAAGDEQQRIDIVKMLVSHMRKEDMELKSVDEGYNALHIAVLVGNMNIVKELMSLMRPVAMEEKDNNGNTALAWALKVGKDEDVIAMAKYMAENNNKVFGIRLPLSWIPVVWACACSKWDSGRSLYSLTPLEFLEPEHGTDGAQFIITCFRAMKLDMALHLLQRCPRLAISPNDFKCSPIMELAGAGMHSAFLSGTQLGFWQNLIYNRLGMQIEPINLNNHHTSINISNQEDDRHNQMDLTCSVIRLYRQLVNGLLELLGINQLRKLKWIHTRSIDVLCCIGKMLEEDNLTSAQLDIVKTSIFKAVEHGNVEFVTRMCQAHPPFLQSYDESNKNIFQYAIECRQNKIYNLMHGLDKEDQSRIGIYVTTYPENILHLAGSLSPLSRFNHIRGAALQIQRELQWFKEVKNILPLEMHEISNSVGMTPRELFTENHEKLKVEAENSIKATATSCTVVGALIITIMFAAAFTVPGGNNGSTGEPMFLTEKLFLAFIISDTLSLIFSTTSVMLFLGIFTSRYAEDDFLKDLPTKMMIGLFTLFLSIVTMMIAFSSALNIMLAEKYSWAVIPSISVACIPIASFIWLQFPLLGEMFWSTYGPGIFDKKKERWVKL